MNKTVILSTNDHADYKLYLPYVQRAWNILGWNTLTLYLGKDSLVSDIKNQIVKIEPVEGYREATVVQTSRLLGYQYVSDGIIMTSDVDMMPLSDYWQPSHDYITCYGYDLTNFTQYPICYIAASKQNWYSLFGDQTLESLLSQYSHGKSEDFNRWWFTDQLIITEKLLYHPKLVSINRGTKNSLAYGRIDRVAWNLTRTDNTPKIDAHMPRPFSKEACIDLIDNVLLNNIQSK